MSYVGKSYNRVKVENMVEVMEKLNFGEILTAILKRGGAIPRYEHNADGSVQYIVTLEDKEIANQRIEHNKETEFPSPDGGIIKSIATIDGDIIKSVLTMPSGNQIHVDRYFEGDKLKVEVHSPSIDIKGVMYYEAI